MKNFLKVIAILAIIGIIIATALLVLDVVGVAEIKDILLKIMLVLGIVALGGLSVSFLSKPRE